MGRRQQTCKHSDCTKARERWSPDGFCLDHAQEAEAQRHEEYMADPQRAVESQLADCETVEDLRDFIREHLLPD